MDILTELKRPFDPSLVKWRVMGGGKKAAYIDARDVMKRLDDVLGADGYQTKFSPIEGGILCELSIKIDGEWITRSDGAQYSKIEPVKGAISGALKRAANAWGIGRYLYYLDSSKYNANNTDKWPKFFTPEGYDKKSESEAEKQAPLSSGMDSEEMYTVSDIDDTDRLSAIAKAHK